MDAAEEDGAHTEELGFQSVSCKCIEVAWNQLLEASFFGVAAAFNPQKATLDIRT